MTLTQAEISQKTTTSPSFQSGAQASEMPLVATDVDQKKKTDESVDKTKTVGQFLLDQKKQIEAALPKHLTSDRMLRIIMTEIRKNPEIGNCTPQSLIGSIMQCSQLGLEPGSALGHAYLIPFNRKIKAGDAFKTIKECQFMIGYRGMIDLSRRSGQVLSLGVRTVYSNDHFEYAYGLNEKCDHIPVQGDRGEFVGAYAVVRLRDDSYYFEFMTKADIDKIRDKSISYSTWVKFGKKGASPIWVEHYDEMAKKTVVRHVFKYLPISIEIQSAVGFDEQADRGEQNNSFIFDHETGEIAEHKSKSDDIANKLNA